MVTVRREVHRQEFEEVKFWGRTMGMAREWSYYVVTVNIDGKRLQITVGADYAEVEINELDIEDEIVMNILWTSKDEYEFEERIRTEVM